MLKRVKLTEISAPTQLRNEARDKILPIRAPPRINHLKMEAAHIKAGQSLMPFGNSGNVVPEGRNENSPAFQRRDEANRRTSPAGTAEIMRPKSRIQSSLRDSEPPAPLPALKR